MAASERKMELTAFNLSVKSASRKCTRIKLQAHGSQKEQLPPLAEKLLANQNREK